MTALAVSVGGQRLATINCEGFDVASVHVNGTRADDPFAALHVRAGRYPAGAESVHLLWLNDVVLGPNAAVQAEVLASGETNPAGQTMDDLFGGEDAQGAEHKAHDFDDPQALSALMAHARAQPNLREGFAFTYASSLGTRLAERSAPDAHGVAFTVLWNGVYPKRVSASLRTCTLDSVETREAGRSVAREILTKGKSVRVTFSEIGQGERA